jgi:hypothetical protein
MLGGTRPAGAVVMGDPMTAVERHLFSPGPKRILALDGGGVRGILTLAILERMEEILRERSSTPDSFRLCDYFDLIGGTSTGSIIASGLALGVSAQELLGLYRNLSSRVFRRPFWSLGIFGPRFSRGPLAAVLNEIIGDITLGSDKIRTGLAVVTKRADNGSVWILHNNPRGRYFAAAPGDTGNTANGDIPLASAILASTAAPTFFRPEFIKVAGQELGAFVDGGVSPHNDPSLHLLMLANLKGYNIGWPLGHERLLLASVGTGFFRHRHSVERLRYTPSVFQAVNALTSMIDDGSRLVQLLLQWASDSPTPRRIDSEIGDLSEDRLTHQPLLHYVRYDGQLEIDWLIERLGITMTREQVLRIQKMDDPRSVEALIEIGRQIAKRHVKAEHFPAVFDIAAPAAA